MNKNILLVTVLVIIIAILGIANYHAPKTDITETPAVEELPVVTVTCTNNPSCTYSGKDMPVQIRISNPAKYSIGFPVEYANNIGPVVLLSETTSDKKLQLKTIGADTNGMNSFTPIAPGASTTLTWTIRAADFKSFIRPLNVDAKFTIAVPIQTHDMAIDSDFSGTDTIRITEKQ